MATPNDNSNHNASSNVAEEDANQDKSFKLYQTIAYFICVIACHLGLYLGFIALFYCWIGGTPFGFSYAISSLMNSICSFFLFWYLKGKKRRRKYRLLCMDFIYFRQNIERT